MEEWKDIKGYEGRYKISSFGNVMSLGRNKSGEIKKPLLSSDGYYLIGLWDGKTTTRVRLNRLVAQHFIPNPHNLPCSCHKDDNPLNNRADNLFWGSFKDNSTDMISKGRKNTVKKLTDEDVRIIRTLYREGQVSQAEISRRYSVHTTTINEIVLNKTRPTVV